MGNIKEKIDSLRVSDLDETSIERIGLIDDVRLLNNQEELVDVLEYFIDRMFTLFESIDNKDDLKVAKAMVSKFLFQFADESVVDRVDEELSKRFPDEEETLDNVVQDDSSDEVSDIEDETIEENVMDAEYEVISEEEIVEEEELVSNRVVALSDGVSSEVNDEEVVLEEGNVEIKSRIEELETELEDVINEANEAKMPLVEYLESEIKKLENRKSLEIKAYDKLMAAINEELERRKVFVTVDDLNLEISKLRDEQKTMVAVTGGYPSDKDIDRYHEINDIVKNIEKEIGYRNSYADMSSEDVRTEIEKLEKEQKDIVAVTLGYPSDKDVERYHEINELISFLKDEAIRKEATKYDVYSDDELRINIDKLSKEQRDIVAVTGGYPSDKDIERYHEINGLVKEYKIELERREANKYIKLSEEEIKSQIGKLEKEQRDIVAVTLGYPNDQDVEKYHEINKIVTELKGELEKRNNDPLRVISGMSKEDLVNKLEDLKNRKKSIQSVTDKKVEELKTKLNKAKELENLRKNKIDKKEHRKDLLYKGLAATAGVVTGLALSSVPGVGTIRMGISGAKLVSSGISAWTRKHPDGKVAKIVDTTKEKLLNNKVVNEFNEKHPNIVSKVKLARDKIKKIASNEKVNCFVNGVAAGYMVGNIIEMVTGETVGEHVSKLFKGGDEADFTTNIVDSTTTQTAPPTEPTIDEVPSVDNPPVETPPVETPPVEMPSVETPPVETPSIDTPPVIDDVVVPGTDVVPDIMDSVSEITLNTGDVIDISGITKGLVSSDSTNFVNLMTSAGREAVVDKFVTLPTGEVMVHFKQINGMGYAWFNLEDVQEYLAKAVDSASRTR